MLKYVYVSPSDFLVVLLGRGRRPGRRRRRWARVITLAIGVVAPRRAVRRRSRSTGRCSSSSWRSGSARSSRSASCSPRSASRRARSRGRTRRPSRAPCSSSAAPSSRSSVLPAPLQAVGLLTPLTWWIEGVAAALFPGGLTLDRRAGSLLRCRRRDAVARAAPRSSLALLATGTVATLAAIAVFRASDRRAKDRGLLDQTTGS